METIDFLVSFGSGTGYSLPGLIKPEGSTTLAVAGPEDRREIIRRAARQTPRRETFDRRYQALFK